MLTEDKQQVLAYVNPFITAVTANHWTISFIIVVDFETHWTIATTTKITAKQTN